MNEYMVDYKKELKTVDIEKIKEVIFKLVYQEIVSKE